MKHLRPVIFMTVVIFSSFSCRETSFSRSGNTRTGGGGNPGPGDPIPNNPYNTTGTGGNGGNGNGGSGLGGGGLGGSGGGVPYQDWERNIGEDQSLNNPFAFNFSWPGSGAYYPVGDLQDNMTTCGLGIDTVRTLKRDYTQSKAAYFMIDITYPNTSAMIYLRTCGVDYAQNMTYPDGTVVVQPAMMGISGPGVNVAQSVIKRTTVFGQSDSLRVTFGAPGRYAIKLVAGIGNTPSTPGDVDDFIVGRLRIVPNLPIKQVGVVRYGLNDNLP